MCGRARERKEVAGSGSRNPGARREGPDPVPSSRFPAYSCRVPTPFAALSGVSNLCQPLPGVVTGGQPTAAQLESFKGAGGAVVLDIRDPMERRPFDEPELARRLGMEYVNVPVVSGALTDQALERVLTTLRGAAGRPLLFHCVSGNRVGGALLPHLLLDQKMDEEDAVNTAMRVGLRSAELLEWGLDFARRKLAAP